MLLEGLRAEFGQKQWNETVEDALAQIEPGFVPSTPPQEVRDNSLKSLAEAGFTVREER